MSVVATNAPVAAVSGEVLPLTTSSGVGNVSNLTVKINVSTTWASDLDIYLVSPAGTVIELSTDNGGSGDNYTDTVFDDNAATLITLGTAPFTGSFRPEQLLSTLNGQSGNGVWKATGTAPAAGWNDSLAFDDSAWTTPVVYGSGETPGLWFDGESSCPEASYSTWFRRPFNLSFPPNYARLTVAVDDGLNENAYIVPGLGDAGDRQYGPR